MNTEIKQEQKNFYRIITSNGNLSDVYVIASNISDAHKIVKNEHKSFGIYYKLKRCYQFGGVR